MAKSIQLKDNDGNVYLPNQVYSTQETKIGVWEDGKPIYRRVFTDLTYSEGTALVAVRNITDVDTVRELTPILFDGEQYKIGNYYYSSSIFFSMNIDIKSGKIYYDNKGQTGTMKIILEYTKTTD